MNKTILIISHVIPEPANAGDALRLRNLIRFFRGQGYKIVCLFHSNACKEEIISNNKGLIDCIYFSNDFCDISTLFNKPYQALKTIIHGSSKAYFCDLHLSLAVKKLCAEHNPSVVMAEYIFMAPYLKYASPATLKIIDTIDVFARKKKEVCDRGIEFPLACTKEEERKYLLHGDLMLGIQPGEAKMLLELVPEKMVVNVGVDMPSNISIKRPCENIRDAKSLLIVAGGNPNNVHGVNQFLEESWPDIYKTDPSVSLRVVGSVCKHVLKEIIFDGVELVGVVDDLALEYENADIVINPVVAGTGLKIKTIEAMSYGKPIISTPNGVEGIVENEHEKTPFMIAESSVDFVNKVLYLLDSDKYRHELGLTVSSYAKKYLAAEYVYNDLKNAVINNSNNILFELKTKQNCFSFIKDLYSCYIILKYGSYDKQYYSKQYPNYLDDFFYKKLWRVHSSSNKFFKHISSLLFHPVIHYVYKGVYKGYDLLSDFDSYYYLDTNYQEIQGYLNPYSHYLTIGKPVGIAPTKEFVSAKYLFEKNNTTSKDISSFTINNFLSVLGASPDVCLVVTHGAGGGANEYLYSFRLPSLCQKHQYVIILSVTLGGAELVVYHNNCKVKLDFPQTIFLQTIKPKKIIINSFYYYDKSLLRDVVKFILNSQADIELLMHDFHSVCPTVNLINESSVFCELKNCENCKAVNKDTKISEWRALWQKLFDKSKEIMFFSRSSFEIVSKVFKLNESSVKIKPHIPLIKYQGEQKYKFEDNRELVVGIVGTLTKAKGAKIVIDMAKRHSHTKFVIIGSVINQYINSLDTLDNVIITGSYNQHDLPYILKANAVTVTVVASVWPETFCYVLQELMQLEYPVVSFNIGAQGERVASYKYGIVVDILNGDAMFEGIKKLEQQGKVYGCQK